MLAFFKHKKFWLPILILFMLFVLTEILLRLGWYDRWIKPRSFLGNVTYRIKAINSIGIENINWITVGDSRMDWGIDHKAIADLRKEQELTHVRMSFGSSKFVSTQTTIDWSMAHMPALEGIMLGLTENAFAHYNYLGKQYKVSWPFRAFMDLDSYDSLEVSEKWAKYYHWFAWSNYFDDIRAFISKPVMRIKKLRRASKTHSPEAILNYRKDSLYNLCERPLGSLEQCIVSSKNLDLTIPELEGYTLINRHCNNLSARKRAFNKLPVPQVKRQDQLIKNWTTLINNVLNKGKKFTMVLLPEHESHDYIIKPSNAGVITKTILAQHIDHPNFRLIDLRKLFDGKESCVYFADPVHFSNLGIDEVNKALINALKE